MLRRAEKLTAGLQADIEAQIATSGIKCLGVRCDDYDHGARFQLGAGFEFIDRHGEVHRHGTKQTVRYGDLDAERVAKFAEETVRHILEWWANDGEIPNRVG